jgi:hypothetical protein
LDWLLKPREGLWLNSYHTCHIYHILCPNMTHMIGMTGVGYLISSEINWTKTEVHTSP